LHDHQSGKGFKGPQWRLLIVILGEKKYFGIYFWEYIPKNKIVKRKLD